VGQELAAYKGMYSSPQRSGGINIFPDEFSLDYLKPRTVGQRFSVSEINEKLAKAFALVHLEKTPFEFELAALNPRTGMPGSVEKQTINFSKVYDDSVNNYSYGYLLITPSGSPAENLAADETLIVVVPNVKNIVFRSLQVKIGTSIFFTLIIIAAFYLNGSYYAKAKKTGKDQE
jgi:two-component system phosphate regulon sensor histidine kinase PhoR